MSTNFAWKQSERKAGERLTKVDGKVKNKYAHLVTSQRTGRVGSMTHLETDYITRSYCVQHKHSSQNAKNPAVHISKEIILHHLDMAEKTFSDLTPIWSFDVAGCPMLFAVTENEFYYLVQLKRLAETYNVGLEQLEDILKHGKK